MKERDEWAQDALNDKDDQAAWEAARNEALGLQGGFVSRAEQIASLAADRAEVMAQGLTGEEWRRCNLIAALGEDAAA